MKYSNKLKRAVLAVFACFTLFLVSGCGPEGPATVQDFFGAVVRGDVAQVKAGLYHHPEWAKTTDAANYNRTALHKACGRGHRDVVELLLSEGAGLNARDQLGYTPLMYAIHGRNSDLAVWLIEEKGARVDVREKNGLTPLHNAAFAGLPHVGL